MLIVRPLNDSYTIECLFRFNLSRPRNSSRIKGPPPEVLSFDDAAMPRSWQRRGTATAIAHCGSVGSSRGERELFAPKDIERQASHWILAFARQSPRQGARFSRVSASQRPRG